MKREEMKAPIRLAVAVVVCVSIVWTAARADAATVWPAYEHDRSHSGRSQYNTSGNNGVIKWELPTGGDKIEDSPTISADGTVYDADTAGNFYAITPGGTTKWSAPFQAIQGVGCSGIPGVNAGAAIGPNGAIYFADQDAQLYSLTDNGSGTNPTLNWGPVQPTGDCTHFVTTGAPTLSIDGSTLYILVSDGKLYAMRTSTGALNWSAVIGTGGSTGTIAPVVGPDGTIYAASSDGKVASVKDNGASASFNWGPTTFAASFSGDTPSLSNDGSTLYIAGNTTSPVGGDLFAITAATGASKWTALTLGSGEVFNTGVALGADGTTIYVGSGKSSSHTLYAVTDGGASGSLKWSMSVGGSSLKVSAAIGSDGTIYVSSGDGNLYAVTDGGVSGSLRTFFGGTGSVLVNLSTAAGYKALSMPAIASDGTIYMSSDTDDNFYAYNGPLVPTPTATATSSPTATASRTATPTATSTRSATATATATATGTTTATATATPTATATVTATSTATPTATTTATATATPTATATVTATRTATPTATATASPTATATVTRTATATATATASPTSTATATPTPTTTGTPTTTATASPTRTATATSTATPTATATSTATATRTATVTVTATPTPTTTATETTTATVSATPSTVRTPVVSATPTATATATATNTATATFTPTPMPTVAAPLIVSPASANFAAKLGKRSKARKITAHNGGMVSISLLGARVTGDFALSKSCGSTLKPKKNCNYAVVFAPTAIGPRPGLLTINNNSSSGPRTVSLSGTGQ
jgi:outer membrane protein assembly factor BamB